MLTEQEIRNMKTLSIIEYLEMSCYQKVYEEALAELDPELYSIKYAEVSKEIEICKKELKRRLEYNV